MKKVHYRKYDFIFTEGSPGDCACIIESGKVGIFREDSLGNRFLVRKLSKTLSPCKIPDA